MMGELLVFLMCAYIVAWTAYCWYCIGYDVAKHKYAPEQEDE